jgi:hypothetical protein
MVDRLMDALGDALHNIALVLPKLLGFIVILLIGLFLAKLVAMAVEKALDAVRFPRLVSRLGVGGVTGPGWNASEVVGKIVYYIGVLFTLLLAFDVWGENNPVSDLLRRLIAFIPNIVVAVILVALAVGIAKALRDVVRGSLANLSYGNVVSGFVYWFIVVIGVIAALNQVGIAVVITNLLLIFLLATVGGILVVGVGGALIAPLRERLAPVVTAGAEEFGTVSEAVRVGAVDDVYSDAEVFGAEADPRAEYAANVEEADASGEGFERTDLRGERRRPKRTKRDNRDDGEDLRPL